MEGDRHLTRQTEAAMPVYMEVDIIDIFVADGKPEVVLEVLADLKKTCSSICMNNCTSNHGKASEIGREK